MSTIINNVILDVSKSDKAFCRYITANDTGSTGAHQYGFYIPKDASKLLFEESGTKGSNKDKNISIKWQNSFTTESRAIYYGKGTRNEYRITRFGRNFPFLTDDNVGDLLIIALQHDGSYNGYVLSSDEDIETFFSTFNISPTSLNKLIDTSTASSEYTKQLLIEQFISKYASFPETCIMATEAQQYYNNTYRISPTHLLSDPDTILINWIKAEYNLFQCLENKLYSNILSRTFQSLDEFIKIANEVLNRRKSRAGKSLEHHLSSIFSANNLFFEAQATTEVGKKPDFIFPNSECYHNFEFPTEDITILGAKTTCKDRWRQIITEGDRVNTKFLFTLQQGISKNQLQEMKLSNVQLVVPHQYIPSFPSEFKNDILSLRSFIDLIKEQQQRPSNIFYIYNRV